METESKELLNRSIESLLRRHFLKQEILSGAFLFFKVLRCPLLRMGIEYGIIIS